MILVDNNEVSRALPFYELCSVAASLVITPQCLKQKVLLKKLMRPSYPFHIWTLLLYGYDKNNNKDNCHVKQCFYS